jgi:hypothetical protein
MILKLDSTASLERVGNQLYFAICMIYQSATQVKVCDLYET